MCVWLGFFSVALQIRNIVGCEDFFFPVKRGFTEIHADSLKRKIVNVVHIYIYNSKIYKVICKVVVNSIKGAIVANFLSTISAIILFIAA